MCASTTMNTLAALQATVHRGIKIDSPVISVNTQMEGIINQITKFVNTADNHTSDALDEFKKLEQFLKFKFILNYKLNKSLAIAKKYLITKVK